MSTLLQKAFAEAAKLPLEEQDFLATQILAELEEEDEFDQKIASTAHRLSQLANDAISEYKSGQL